MTCIFGTFNARLYASFWEETEQMMAALVPCCVGQSGQVLALHTKETKHSPYLWTVSLSEGWAMRNYPQPQKRSK